MPSVSVDVGAGCTEGLSCRTNLRVPPFVLPMELPPTATMTEAPLLLLP